MKTEGDEMNDESKDEIEVLIPDIDGSMMVQGGPIDPKVAKIFRVLSGLGIKVGPATGKNCDYARGLACGIGTVWDFVIGETGAQFLETISKGPPPAFRQRKVFDVGNDISIFAKRIELNLYDRTFAFYDRRENFRPELKEGIITLFPPDQDIEITKSWVPYFEAVIKAYRLNLNIQRHSDGCVDIVPMQISKELGVEQVCRLFGCNRSNILVVVDGVNDLELTRGTRVIAVSNAVPEIKEAARLSGGFIANFPDGKGFLEGLLYFSRSGYFNKKTAEEIIENINNLNIF